MIYYKKSRIKRLFQNFAKVKIPKFRFGFLKYLALFLVIIVGFIYTLYLYFLPKYFSEDRIEAVLNDYLSENSKLSIDIDNSKIYPNYKFDLNFKADKINILYPDKSVFISLEKPSFEVNLATLALKYIDLNKIQTRKIAINTTFTKNKNYDCFDYFNFDIFNLKSNNSSFKLRNIKIFCDEFLFNLKDENANSNYLLQTSKVRLSASELDKPLLLETSGKIKSKNKTLSDFKLNLKYTISKELLEELKSAIYNLNFNPLNEADKYNFYALADINLSLDKTNITGFINLEDLSFKIGGFHLPKNNLNLVFKEDKIKALCDFKFFKDQFINISLAASHSKNKFIELKLKSNEINLSELKLAAATLFKIFNLNYNLDNISLSGTACADIYLKSNFKTITSFGTALVKNAQLIDKSTGLTLNNINSDINFENNKINIKEADANVGNSRFYLRGLIDEKTNLDLKARSDTINIAQIVKLAQSLPFVSCFLPELDDYIFEKGFVNINTDIKGSFKNPIITTNSRLFDLLIHIKSLKSDFSASEIKFSAAPQNGSIDSILASASNCRIKYQKYLTKINTAQFKISKDEITIEKTQGTLDNNPFEAQGKIKNYKKDFSADFNLKINLPSKNDFLVIKNKSAILSLCALVNKNKIQILNGELKEQNRALASFSGNILNYSKTPVFDNFKISTNGLVGINIPNIENLSFEVDVELNLSGNLEKPQLSGDVKLYHLLSLTLGLNIKEIFLNIKNSNCYINISRGKIFGFDFDFTAEADILKDKISAKYAHFSSTYINLDELQKYQDKFQDKIKLEIAELKGNIQTVESGDIILGSLSFEGNLKDDILNISKFEGNIFEGKIQGSIKANLKTLKTNSEIILKEIYVRSLSRSLKDFSIAASGKLSALSRLEFQGFDYNSALKSLKGYVKFNIDNGELAQFARLERYLQAGNILSQSILKLTLNSALSAITKQNTGDFKTIEGTVKIDSPTAQIQYINTQGTNMSTRTEGTCNIITQSAHLKILGRIPSSTVRVMGDIGSFSLSDKVEKMTDDAKNIIKSITKSPIENMMTIELEADEISKIPPLVNPQSDITTREFIVRTDGAINSAGSVKVFKWIQKN